MCFLNAHTYIAYMYGYVCICLLMCWYLVCMCVHVYFRSFWCFCNVDFWWRNYLNKWPGIPPTSISDNTLRERRDLLADFNVACNIFLCNLLLCWELLQFSVIRKKWLFSHYTIQQKRLLWSIEPNQIFFYRLFHRRKYNFSVLEASL